MRNIAPVASPIVRLLSKIVIRLASILLLMALAGCNNFNQEFVVTSADALIKIGTDGVAVASETFGVLVRKPDNYGGVYVDIPELFSNTDGAHWRDFQFLAARRDGESEYASIENSLQGHAVYIGKEHCRSCHPDLPPGPLKISIDYKLDRLVHDEGDHQVLVLPAYMASVHDQNGSKSLTFEVPRGGIKRPSAASASYNVTLDDEGKLVVFFPERKSRLPSPDIEIEYPKGTFAAAVSGSVAWWWVSDHLVVFASAIGPAIFILAVFVFFWMRHRLQPGILGREGELLEEVSPGLAAYIHFNRAPRAKEEGIIASLCQLAIVGKLRLSAIGRDGEVCDLPNDGEDERDRRPRPPASLETVMACVEAKCGESVRTQLRRVIDESDVAFRRATAEEYEGIRSESLMLIKMALALIFASAALLAYLAGVITFSLSFFALILVPLAVFALARRPGPFLDIDRNWNRFKALMGALVVILLTIGLALGHITANSVSLDQLFYFMFICFDVAGMVFLLVTSHRPSPRQRRIGDRLGELRSYLKGDTAGPEMSAATYERYLPFAIALGVETRWTARFNGWREETGMETYAPEWLVPQNPV